MIARGYLKDVKSKEVSWLWKPYIGFGKVTLIQGDTGIGKTSLLMKVIADLSNGIFPPTMFRECLQPQEKGKPLITYYISIENGIDDTIVPLFDLLGGNREYVQYQEERNGHFVLTGDEIRECVKMTGAELNNTLRSILTVKDGNDPSERQLTVTKMSFLGKEVTPVVFRQDEKYKISYVYDDYSMENEDAPMEDQDRSGGRRLSKGERTAEFIREILADGPLDSNEVKRRVNESEFSMTTVNRIKDGIVIIEQQSDKSSLWRLKG